MSASNTLCNNNGERERENQIMVSFMCLLDITMGTKIMHEEELCKYKNNTSIPVTHMERDQVVSSMQVK